MSSNMIPTDKEEFVARFGGVYEHSTWIAADSWPACQMAHDAEQLAAIMASTVESASRHDKLALIRAHPDLAGRLAVASPAGAGGGETVRARSRPRRNWPS